MRARHRSWLVGLVGTALVVASGVWGVRGGTQGGGLGHAVLNTPAGVVWTWGYNADGQLGNNSTTARRYAGTVSGLGTITAVAAGASHTLALDDTGRVWAWGDNLYGAVGDGTTTDRLVPVQLALTSVTKIAAGGSHSLALLSTGELYVWGRNTYGQLGLGTTTQQNSPTLLMSGITAMAGGAHHSVMVKTDGTAWTFGYNYYGQLGNGSTTQSTSPVQMTGITSATSVAAGYAHTVVLRTDNTVRAAGTGGYGQLGDATGSQRTTAVAVSGLSTVVEIAAGDYHSLALLADGTVRGWGENSVGSVGDGTQTGRYAPVTVSGLSSIAGIGGGSAFGVAVSTTGVVYAWGSNNYGEQGDGSVTTPALSPHPISGASYDWKVTTPTLNVASGTYTVAQTVTVQNVMNGLSGFEMHYTTNGGAPTTSDPSVTHNGTIGVTQSQTLKVKAWVTSMPPSETATRAYTLQVVAPTASPSGGSNLATTQTVTLSTSTSGATVRYTTDGSTPTSGSTAYTSPIAISTSTVLKAIAVKSGWSDSTLLSATYAFNYGTLAAPTVSPAAGAYTTSAEVTMSSAQSGAVVRYTTNGTAPTSTSTLYTAPVTLTATTTIRAKAFHPDYTTSAETSRAYELVTATPTFSLAPGSYAAGTAVTVSTATPGATINYSLDGAGPLVTHPTVASGGTIIVGNFTLKAKAWASGQSSSATATAAYTVTGAVTTPMVSGGTYHSLAVRGDGAVFAWGGNTGYELGDGTNSQRTLPIQTGGVTGVTMVSGGQNFSIARLADGTVRGWGTNNAGQLGDGTSTSPRTWPVVTSGLSSAVAVDAGTSHGLALLSDGTVRAWGLNTSSQLGDGSVTQRNSPVTVTGLSSVSRVAGGTNFSLAVKTDGTVWSWGGNGNGQLGTGNTTGRSTAGSVSGLTTTVAVAAGNATSYAVLSDGTVRAWGYNGNGSIGDGSFTQRLSPVTVTGVSGVSTIAVGEGHALVLKADGSVWAWGQNGHGQVGNGSTSDLTTAVQVNGLPTIAVIGAGLYQSLAIGTDGSVWAWGRNSNGQIGDASTTNRTTPVQIAAAGMGWQMPAPVLNVASGTYSTNQTVTVTNNDTSATMRYTTDGTDPTTSTTTTVSSGGTVSVTQSVTLKVKAWRTGYLPSLTSTGVYELKVVTPTASPGTGAYGSTQNVTLSTTTSGATIRYTTDATEPTTSSTSYASPVAVSTTLTLRAKGFKTGWTPSDSVTPSYWISAGTVATPTASPAAGTFTATPLVTLASATSGASIRYTLDGSDPTAASPLYRYPFVVGATTTVKARAFKTGMTQSALLMGGYAVDAAGATATPTITPDGGTFTTRRTVTITGPVGASLRYTTTGIDPTASDTLVPGGGQVVVDRAQILKVRAWATGFTQSAVRRADFVITGAIAAGSYHTLALKEDGTVWAWGRNDNGQIGDNGIVNQWAPVQVLTNAVAIAAGTMHSLAVKADGTVWSWGQNTYSQLGRSGNTFAPLQVAGITNAVAVAGGSSHSLVLKADGTVWAFGANAAGQIGDGTPTPRATPVPVLGLAGVTAVAAGTETSAAVQSDAAGGGWLFTWGKNTVGQLGDGTQVARLTAVRVPLGAMALEVVAGADMMVARRADLTVATWGGNAFGQLGLGASTNRSLPTGLGVLSGVRHIAAGRDHVLSQDARGRVVAWGSNGTSRFGAGPDAPTANAITPYSTMFSSVLALSAGAEHSVAIATGGGVISAGYGWYGQLGTGTQADAPAPVAAGTFTVATNTWLTADTDGDGLSNWREYLFGTDPLNVDTNGNGVADGVEVASGTSDAGDPDTDGDGVANWIEVGLGTDPFRIDSDGDGVNDGADCYPLDASRWQAPTPTPGDVTPPVITLTYPTGAKPVP